MQTQNFYHGKGQKYMMWMSIILYIENFLKIKENKDHHIKIKLKLYWFFRKNLNQIQRIMQWLNFLKTNLGLKFLKAQLEEHRKNMNIIILDLKYPQKILGKSNKKDYIGIEYI